MCLKLYLQKEINNMDKNHYISPVIANDEVLYR